MPQGEVQGPYEICFMVGVCMQGKYLGRLKNFLEYGLLNTNRRICVDLLASVEDEPVDRLPALPPEVPHIDHRFHFYDTGGVRGVAQNMVKFCKYLLAGDYPQARWYVRIDDDSCTDVSLLLRLLDQEFIPGDHHFLIAHRLCDMDLPLVRALKREGIDITGCGVADPNDGGSACPFFIHEWEFGCFSANTFHRAMDSEEVRKILALVSRSGGNADQLTAVMARVVKVHASHFPWATPHACVTEFSFLAENGIPRYCHIHYLAEDVDSRLWEFFLQMLRTPGEPLKAFCEVTKAHQRPACYDVREMDIVEGEFIFDFGHGKSRLRFNADRTIGLRNHDQQRYWDLCDGLLTIRNRNRALTAVFMATTPIASNSMAGFLLDSWDSIHLNRSAGPEA